MTLPHPVTPIANDCDIQLAITAGKQPELLWERQLDLLRSTKATFEDGAWYLWTDGSSLTAPKLEPLWRAVLEYGASVRIDAIKPRSTP